MPANCAGGNALVSNSAGIVRHDLISEDENVAIDSGVIETCVYLENQSPKSHEETRKIVGKIEMSLKEIVLVRILLMMTPAYVADTQIII
jgi:hypothetical protein